MSNLVIQSLKRGFHGAKKKRNFLIKLIICNMVKLVYVRKDARAVVEWIGSEERYIDRVIRGKCLAWGQGGRGLWSRESLGTPACVVGLTQISGNLSLEWPGSCKALRSRIFIFEALMESRIHLAIHDPRKVESCDS